MKTKLMRFVSLVCIVAMLVVQTTSVLASTTSTADNNAYQVSVGETVTLSAPSSGWFSSTTWESSNEAIATVSSKGVVTGISVGETTVTATTSKSNFFSFWGSSSSSSSTTEYLITVIEAEEEEPSAADYEIAVGEIVNLPVPSSGTTIWTSSDDTVASVSDGGVVTGISAGEATITATTTTTTSSSGSSGGFFSIFFSKWFGSGSSSSSSTTTTQTYVIKVTGEGSVEPSEPTDPEEPTDPSEPEEPTDPDVTYYTVTFESNGGTEVEAQMVAEGETATEPEEPTMDGYTFNDWCVDEELLTVYDFSAEVTADITLYASWNQEEVDLEEDSDDDGMPDAIEEALGLSTETDDTDGDGIDDYTEIYVIGSDATVADSDDDADEDGLTNYDEVNVYGTSPVQPDTDFDGLSDSEEINTYGTDPLAADTDGDGVSDGYEVTVLGTDPLTADESFDVTVSADNEDTVETSVSINNLDGSSVETLAVDPVDNEVLFPETMPGYLGMAYDFSVDGDFEEATISFTFDESLLDDESFDPVIYYYDESEGILEELETTVSGNTASAIVTHFSTYILINRTIFNASFTWTDVWSDSESYDNVEIVFVIDDSGSMSSNDPDDERLTVAQNLIDNLPENSQIGVVRFTSSTYILTESLTSDRDEAKSYLTTSYFKSSGNTYMYTAINDSFDLFGDSSSALKMMVVLSDGATSDKSQHSSTIETANELGVRIYTVDLGSSTSYFTSYLQPLAEETGAAFYLASDASELSAIYEDIGTRIDIETDSDGDGLPDYYEENMVLFNGCRCVTDKNKADTDGDDLADGEEIVLVYEYNEDNTQVIVKGRVYSDPTLKDSDYDGVVDSKEYLTKRLDPSFDGSMLGYYDVNDAEYTLDYRAFFGDSSTYSDSISSASLIFANTIYDEKGYATGYDYDDVSAPTDDKGNKLTKITDISQMMECHGFEKVVDYSLADGYSGEISGEAYSDDDISEVAIGYHEVTYNGTTKIVLGVVIRGTNGTIEEWSSNFDLGDPDEWDSEYHKAFYITEQRIKKFLDEYVSYYLSDAENVTYWVTGHSRGAALSNILAADLIDEGKTVFGYTFATPATTTNTSATASKYNSIFNFANTSDVITYVPLALWGFQRFGVTYSLSIVDSGLEDEWCEQTGEDDYSALNKSVINNAAEQIYSTCASSWSEVFDRSGSQNINDDQYACISSRAKQYCDLEERTSIFGNHKGYKLSPSTAFVLQLLAEILQADEDVKDDAKSIMSELINTKYGAAVALFLVGNLGNGLFTENMELVEDVHPTATYYVLIHNM
ncbi:MAG: InlB B-repeat-containing protein [Clostridiales bacterium]|nr:InlB B-repeat-containing protein [Clostridiales bacterium]